MFFQTFANLEHSLMHKLHEAPVTYILSSILFFFIATISAKSVARPKSEIPFHGEVYMKPWMPKLRWMTDCVGLLKEGYTKYGDKPFKVWTSEGPQVVLPPKFFDEVKMLPDHTMPQSTFEFFQGKHTTVTAPWRPDRITSVIKDQLNKNMPKLFPGVKDELDASLPLEFPTFNDWTASKVYPKVVRLVCRISGRAFAGPTLHGNEEWMQTNIYYTRDVLHAAVIIREFPPFIRPLVKYFIPSIRRIWGHNKKATGFITPIIQQRDRDEKMPGYEKPNDTLQWIRDSLPEEEKDDYLYQAILQLGIGASAIHTTTQMVTNILFNLAAYPEYLPELREEVTEVLTAHDGVWTIESMAHLKKMDSFMKESQRHGGGPTISFQRKTLKPVTLSDGTVLPENTYLFSPSAAILSDSKIYTRPDEFNGFRFYYLRQENAEEDKKHQFISTGPTQQSFGGGRHGCPGRWFASYEIKLILATIIMKYDIKLKDGESRPKNTLFQTHNIPNPNYEIMWKSRDV